jgi:hypothetical protein
MLEGTKYNSFSFTKPLQLTFNALFPKEKQIDGIKIRNYEASLFTSVPLSKNSYRKTSRKDFSKLIGYIFGANKTKTA